MPVLQESPQDYVRNSKAFKSNQFVLRLFALAGSKFIGVSPAPLPIVSIVLLIPFWCEQAQFLKAMKHPSAAPTTETKTCASAVRCLSSTWTE